MGHGARGLQRGATPGTISATTRRARAPTAGARTASPGSPTTSSILCFALALWNGGDPILKERLFGLTNSEGNHGEDVKEYYFYLDSTPTHSYMKYLYKYPQARVSRTTDLVADQPQRATGTSSSTSCSTPASSTRTATSTSSSSTRRPRPKTSSCRITVANRGPEAAPLHVLPTLWFRNTWSWGSDVAEARPAAGSSGPTRRRRGRRLARRARRALPLLRRRRRRCCSPRTRPTRSASSARRTRRPCVKDGIDSYVVHGQTDAVNPARTGTKAAAHYRARPSAPGAAARDPAAPDAGATLAGAGDRRRSARLRRRVPGAAREADEFYAAHHAAGVGADGALVMRQALAGMLWTKQYYYYDIDAWLHGARRRSLRTRSGVVRCRNPRGPTWSTPTSSRCPTSGSTRGTRPGTSRSTRSRWPRRPRLRQAAAAAAARAAYLHPNGQMPAYEWNFSDVNPPVHAWAALVRLQPREGAARRGRPRVPRAIFQKLLLNFTWWVNRKDPRGRNVFEGGFLGLDNIGVFDRSAPLPTGGHLEQADGTAWMAFYCQSMLQIALELALHDPVYEDMALKFFEHFLWIAARDGPRRRPRTTSCGTRRTASSTTCCALPDGSAVRLKVRSMVGLLPLCASTVFAPDGRARCPSSAARAGRFTRRHPHAGRQHHDPPAGPATAAAACSRCSTRTSCAACWRACSTRTSS